jgi:hypothetical protein
MVVGRKDSETGGIETGVLAEMKGWLKWQKEK